MAKISDFRRFVEFGKKIVACGRNYKAHATELGNTVLPEPMLFLKPTTSYLKEGGKIIFPPKCTELHYEVELAVVIGQGGSKISEAKAMDHVAGYALALDMTARNLQADAKKNGWPWSVAKGYDTFCPISDFIEKEKINPSDTHLWLKVDEEMRQDGNTKDMIFSVPFLISYISDIFTLEGGDVILTGTPSGVGPVNRGQTITAGIEGILEMKFPIV